MWHDSSEFNMLNWSARNLLLTMLKTFMLLNIWKLWDRFNSNFLFFSSSPVRRLPKSAHTHPLQLPFILFLPIYMIYWYFLWMCWRRSIREHANEIYSFRTEAFHEQFCLHLHLLYRMREMETNAFGPVPPTNTELSPCRSCHWQAKTSNFCKWLAWQGQTVCHFWLPVFRGIARRQLLHWTLQLLPRQ